MLHCSEWWVKEQARQRRIPYCWIGGGYRFTDEHVAEVARLFEVRPSASVAPAGSGTAMSQTPADNTAAPVVRLTARVPRRLRDRQPGTAA
jgi:hypothetical protein